MTEDIEQYNADDPKQVNAAKRKEKREKFLRDEVIRKLMTSKDGRTWIQHILDEADMFGNPIVRGDPHGTYSNIGMANLAKLIWIEVEEAAPESCLLMRKEAKENEKPDPTNTA